MMKKKAFTLTELLLSCSIFAFILFILFAILMITRSSWITAQVQADLYQNARKALDEMSRELVETSEGNDTMGVFTFVDPINGKYEQGFWFASGRGSPNEASEDGEHLGNNYVHLDNTYNYVVWRSLVVYCPYQTASGQRQLRRYVDYGTSVSYYNGADIFPLDFEEALASATTFSFKEANGLTTITIDRTGGKILANYLDSEDDDDDNTLDSNEDDGSASLPIDNADGVLNYGANFNKNASTVDIALFLKKEVTRLRQRGRVLMITLRNTIKRRQP